MSNIAAVLKEEIRRLARREVKVSTSSTKGAMAQYRSAIAKLKRELQEQQKKTAFLEARERKRLSQPQAAADGEPEGVRYSARSVRAQRKRLALSQQGYAKLVGVSVVTIYNWESGHSRPRQQQLAALVAVRKMGRREALAKLDAMKVKTLRTKKPR
jgi:DNA-binding transcriptional regulator YiaG